ncbi:hypothetical protein OROGR_029361 [Orobanche gracilis]
MISPIPTHGHRFQGCINNHLQDVNHHRRPAVAFSFFCNPSVLNDFNSGCPELWRDPFELLPSWMSDFTNPDPQPPS